MISSSQIARAVIKTFSVNEDSDESDNGNISTKAQPMSIEDKLTLWDKTQHTTDAADRTPWDDGVDEGEYDAFPELQEYRDVLLRSPAFSWLLNSVLNETKLEIPRGEHENAQAQIRQVIIGRLSTEPIVIRRGMTPPRHYMVFETAWPGRFLSREYDMLPHEALDRVLVLTGETENSWATTCGQYVQTVWPDFGPQILETYKALLKGEHTHTRKLSKSAAVL